MSRAAYAVPIAAILLAVLLPGALAQPGGPLVATVTGPAALAPATAGFYNLSIEGGPSGNVNYTVNYYVTGANTSGASPLPSNPGRSTGNRTTVRLNVTAPTAVGTITLVVTVSAAVKGVAPENATTSYPIVVVTPIVLTATFHNSSATVALNVTIRWYVDNALVGTSLLKQISGNADATVTFDYLPVALAQGQHTVTATADLDHDGIIDPARGEVQTTTLFYNQAAPLATGWLLVLGIAIFIPVFLVVVALRRRGER